jgi:hypothetical protein
MARAKKLDVSREISKALAEGGILINIMDLGPLHDEVKAAVKAGRDALEAAREIAPKYKAAV